VNRGSALLRMTTQPPKSPLTETRRGSSSSELSPRGDRLVCQSDLFCEDRAILLRKSANSPTVGMPERCLGQVGVGQGDPNTLLTRDPSIKDSSSSRKSLVLPNKTLSSSRIILVPSIMKRFRSSVPQYYSINSSPRSRSSNKRSPNSNPQPKCPDNHSDSGNHNGSDKRSRNSNA